MALHSIDSVRIHKGYLWGLYITAVLWMVVGTLVFHDDHAFWYGFGVAVATGFVHVFSDKT